MKILVTGAAGMLGSALIPELIAAGHDVQPTDLVSTGDRPWGAEGPSLGHLDVRSREQIHDWFGRLRPDFVIHLAAETDVEICERDRDHAYLTNALGTKYVALECQEPEIPLAYVSTAGVFDGEKVEPYTELDEARPINAYGGSKLAGELLLRAHLRRFYIVRAGWMVGGGPKDHKFVAKILGQIATGSKKLHAVGDKIGTPTYAPDFSRCFTKLISTGSYGLYHMACLGRGTRYDVAKVILETLGRDDIELVDVGSEFFQDSYPAARPRSEMMRNMMLDLQGLNTMRPWREALAEYLDTAFADLRVTKVAR